MLLQGNQGQTGKSVGQNITVGFGEYSDQMVTELMARYYEMNYRGQMFSAGSSTTALSANTITLTATTTPIVGVWNPSTSLVNLVVLQASLQVSVQVAGSTAQGSFVWASSIANAAISTGTAPFNRKTLSLTGSAAKAFNGGVALTGLTNNLVIFEGADFGGGLAITTVGVTAATVVPTYAYVQNFDGSLIVPPGGVLALLNTVSTTNLSVASRLMWAEVAI